MQKKKDPSFMAMRTPMRPMLSTFIPYNQNNTPSSVSSFYWRLPSENYYFITVVGLG
jgi:hypothetical protein